MVYLFIILVLAVALGVTYYFGFMVNDANISANIRNREKAVQELKKVLTNKEWIKENLYLNENIYGEKISESKEQDILFEVISNENGETPIIVVQTEVDNSKQLAILRYKNGEVNIKIWEPQNGSRMSYEIKDDILTEFWLAMGDWSYKVYKIDETSEKQIEANEGFDNGDTDLEEVIGKHSTKPISKELNNTNVDMYIK